MDTGFSLLIKQLAQPLSPRERRELDEWRCYTPENRQLFSEITRLRLLSEYNRRNTIAATAHALARTLAKIRRRARGRLLLRITRYAAALLAAATLTLPVRKPSTAAKYTAITVSGNETVKKIHLPDGTTVWLGASSELQIPETYTSANRTVALKGKAYFDVEKNPESPLLVTTPCMNIKVTGTSFNICVDDRNRHTETVLVSGTVVLQDNRGKEIFEMSPGERVLYTVAGNSYTVSTVDVNTFTSWHLDQITFENASLREIVNKLSRLYDVNINLESKKLADRRYRCVINREETLEEALGILSYLAPIHYRIEDSEVFISERKIE
ncbi:MAG: FecR family protein [Proteiniphilum sp.]|jgi:ferric-dicitrate binding protein FerR (iron transport regulator)|nr:FecR family protein [Proteiniphilum sp.]